MYIKGEQVKHNEDPPKFLQVIEKAWTPKNDKNSHISLTDKKITSERIEPGKVPDTCNNHLCSIASKLTIKFDKKTIPFLETVNDVMEEMIDGQITLNEVHDHVKKIETHKTSAIDKIFSKFLKVSLEALIPQLTHLFNCSIATLVFPEKWKIANVVLIHEGGNKNDVNNFRPISLLPTPRKMLEKIIHGRIYAHLDNNNLLTDKQWGFAPTTPQHLRLQN